MCMVKCKKETKVVLELTVDEAVGLASMLHQHTSVAVREGYHITSIYCELAKNGIKGRNNTIAVGTVVLSLTQDIKKLSKEISDAAAEFV